MTLRLLVIPFLCLLTSCATIMNKKVSTTTIHLKQPALLVMKGDTIHVDQREFPLTLPRSSQPVHIMAISDSQEIRVTLNPYSSFAYYANIFCNYGIGMLVEKNNPKRYTYPRHLYLYPNSRYKTYFDDIRKGGVDLHLSIPYINNFVMRPEGEKTKANTGFWGISLGLNYHHSDKQFLQLTTAVVTDWFMPFPAAVDISGEYELMTSAYTAISNNHRWKRFTTGYGISLAKYTWDLRYYDRFDPPPATRSPEIKRHYALGFLLSNYYNISRSFHVGLVYRPTILRMSKPSKFMYEHLVSIDAAWRIRLKQ